MKTIYDLDLHDEIQICAATYCMRVPGGWIYTIITPSGTTSAFVPFNSEFLRSK